MTLIAYQAEIRQACIDHLTTGKPLPMRFVVVPNADSQTVVTPPYNKAASVAKRFGAPSREHTAVCAALDTGAQQVCIINPIALVNQLERFDDARHILTAIAMMAGDEVSEQLADRAANATHLKPG